MAAADVVIVGAGLLGAVTARRLADAGAQVLVVEGGRPVSDPPGSHVRNSSPFRDDPDGYFPAIDAYFDYLDPDVGADRLPGAFTTAVDGGMGIVWTNNCPRAVSGVDRPSTVPDPEWDECYLAAERYLGVTTDEFEDSQRQRRIARRLTAPMEDAGRTVRRLPLAGHRTAEGGIHYVGPADVLPSGSAGVTLLRGTVERLECQGRRVSAVVDGRPVDAGAVVLAAGAIASPRLLEGCGLGGPALGRYLSYHPVLFSQVVLGEALAGEGPDTVPRLCVPPGPDHPWLVMVLRDTNPLAPAPPDERVAAHRLVEIQAFAPVDPHPDNRMTFSAGELEFSLPLRRPDEERMRAMERDAAEIGGMLGRFRAGCEPQWTPLGTAHLMGSCRAGPDDGSAVVDPVGRVWGTDNAYVVGNAVIPTAIGVNPTLTAAALAVRTADHVGR